MAKETTMSEHIFSYISSNKIFCTIMFMVCVLFAMFLHQQGRVTMTKKPAFTQKFPITPNISKSNKSKKKKKKNCEAELFNKTNKKVEQEEPLKKNEKKKKKNKKKVENEDDYKQISDRKLDGDDGLGEWKVVAKQQTRKKRQSGDHSNDTNALYYTMPPTAKDVAPRFARAAGEDWKETRTNSRRRNTSNTPPLSKSTRSTPTSQLSRDSCMQRTKSSLSITSACASPPIQKWNLNFDAPKQKTSVAKPSLFDNSENKKWSHINTESQPSQQETQSAFKSFFHSSSITSDPWNNNTSTSSASWNNSNKSSTVWPASSCQADTNSFKRGLGLKWTSNSNIGAAREQLFSMTSDFFSTSPPVSVATGAAEKNFFLPCGLLGGSESDHNNRKDDDRDSAFNFTSPSLSSTSQFKAVPYTSNVGSASFMPQRRHNDESGLGHQLWSGNDPLTSRDFSRIHQNFGNYGGWSNYDFNYSNTSLFSNSTKSLWSTGRDELNSYTSSITPTFFQPQPDLSFELPLDDYKAKNEEKKQQKALEELTLKQKQAKSEVRASSAVEVNPWNKDPNMQCLNDDGQVNEDWAAPEESWSNVNEEWEIPVIKQKPEPKYFNSSSDENTKLRNLNFESSSKKSKRRRKKKNQNNHNSVVGCSSNPPFAETSFHHQPSCVTSQSNDCSFSHFGSGDSDGSTGLKKRKNVSKTTSQ